MHFFEKQDEQIKQLLVNIKTNFKELEKLHKLVNDHWCYEDSIYRFYHYSFKVYYLQNYTKQCVEFLKKIAPENIEFNSLFENIFQDGTNKTFKMSHNKNWQKHTRPIAEAFFHAKYFIEMAYKYGKEIETIPTVMPSGWAGLLYFYNLR
jgi:hypothetical protein